MKSYNEDPSSFTFDSRISAIVEIKDKEENITKFKQYGLSIAEENNSIALHICSDNKESVSIVFNKTK